MSRHKDDRKFQSKTGKQIPKTSRAAGDALSRRDSFTLVVAAALRQEYGHTGSAIKSVAIIADANERAVRNWFEAKNGPSGMHLVSLIQHSDRVLEALLTLSGRGDLVSRLELTEFCKELRRLLAHLEGALPRRKD